MNRASSVIFLLCIFFMLKADAQGTWTWLHGDHNQSGQVFGTKGIPGPTVTPGHIYEGGEWMDKNGNFWVFGPDNNSLWKYDPKINQWTWIGGQTTSFNVFGKYGTQGIPSPANWPGGRGYSIVTWTDTSGNFWLFGGWGYGETTIPRPLNDLWKYDVKSGMWTWMRGSKNGPASGSYGTMKVSSPTNDPPGRSETASRWVDNNNNLWLFGGQDYNGNTYNDLWKYNIQTNEWTWMSGSNTINHPGNYGTKGIAASGNIPPSRYSYTHWKDRNGNLWLWGGFQKNLNASYNDLWKYDISTGLWTWVSGSNQINKNDNLYGDCIVNNLSSPGAAGETRACWTDACGNFWLMKNGLWYYNVDNNRWTMVKSGPLNYGTKGIPKNSNNPPFYYGAMNAEDPMGNFIYYANGDVWKYAPDKKCPEPSLPVKLTLGIDSIRGCSPNFKVYFNSNVKQGNFKWTFGDGSSDSTQGKPVHNYISGTYTIKLKGYQSFCSPMLDSVTYILKLQSTAFSLKDTIKPSTCYGDGSIHLGIIGGKSPFTATWNPSGSGLKRDSLIAGNYSVLVRDSIGCAVTASYTVGFTGKSLQISDTISKSVCLKKGSVRLGASNGIAPYSYSWAGGGTGPAKTGLNSGNILVTITDSKGCKKFSTYTIPDSSYIIGINDTLIKSYCSNSNGAIKTGATNGIPPFNYSWTSFNGRIMSGIYAGNYQVTITDKIGCTGTKSISLGDTTPVVSFHDTLLKPRCGLANGSIKVGITGTAGPFSYYWWSTNDTTRTISGIGANFYDLTIIDGHGCGYYYTFNLTDTMVNFLSNDTILDAYCGNANGSIKLHPSGGSPPYYFSWNTGSNLSTLTSIPGGSYSVTITDAYGCRQTKTFTVGNKQINLTLNDTLNNGICGKPLGSIHLGAGSGTPPYNYQWSNGMSGAVVTGLAAGTYSVSLTDKNACTKSWNFSIQDNSYVVQLMDSTKNTLCGQALGEISLKASTGQAPYQYFWNTGQTQSKISTLLPGTYQVTVTDNAGCTGNGAYTVRDSLVNYAVTDTIKHTTCGNAKGKILLGVSGNNLSYQWSNGSTTKNQIDILAGNYTLTISDQQGCSQKNNFTVQDSIIVLQIKDSLNRSICGGSNGSIFLQTLNGSAPYTYQWSNGVSGGNLLNISSGNYNVTISDQNGCSQKLNLLLGDTMIMLNVQTSINTAFCGLPNGGIQVLTTGGSAPYQYLWNGGSTSNNRTGLSGGTYNLTVSDVNGCRNALSILVPDSAVNFSVADTMVKTICGLKNGSIHLGINSGSLPYSYLWSNGSTNNNLDSISAGIYTVTITDFTGCSKTYSYQIPDSLVQIIVSPLMVSSRCGKPTGSIQLSPIGGYPPYKANWSNGGTGLSQINILSGNYSVTISDKIGCTGNSILNLGDSSYAISINKEIKKPFCNKSNGLIRTFPLNGISPYNFRWSNGSTSQSLINLTPGNYTLSITDKQGCSGQLALNLADSAVIFNMNADIIPAFCGQSDGMIKARVSGGKPPYQFSWNQVQGDSIIENIPPGNYKCIVSDVQGCIGEKEFNLGSKSQVIYVHIEVEKDSVYPGEASRLLAHVSPPGNYNYKWTPQTALDDPYISNPITKPDNTIHYKVEVFQGNCKAMDSAFIYIKSPPPVECKFPEIFIPDAFSPNGDGQNDQLSVYGKNIRILHLEVFNRLGEKVFESFDQSNSWDGRYRNEKAIPGTYIYQLKAECQNGEVYYKKGNVTLLR